MLSYRGSETIRDLTTVGYFVNYIIALNGFFFYYYLCVCVCRSVPSRYYATRKQQLYISFLC